MSTNEGQEKPVSKALFNQQLSEKYEDQENLLKLNGIICQLVNSRHTSFLIEPKD